MSRDSVESCRWPDDDTNRYAKPDHDDVVADAFEECLGINQPQPGDDSSALVDVDEQPAEAADPGDSADETDLYPLASGLSMPGQRSEIIAEGDAQRIIDTIQNIRLLEDFGTGDVIGVATWPKGAWYWEYVELTTPVDRFFRAAGIEFITDLLAPMIKGLAARPSDVDEAAGIASLIEPGIVFLTVCNLAVRGAACHLGLALIAPALGSLAAQTLGPMVERADPSSEMEQRIQVIDVTVDVLFGDLTPNVYDVALAKLDDLLMGKMRGITRKELDAIMALIA